MRTIGKQVRLLLVISLATLGALHVSAQQRQTYACDFEDARENRLWQLNMGHMGAQCVNRWHIGSAVNNGGASSLYISCDGGLTAGYAESALSVSCARTITLSAGTYILCFDWQALGYDGHDALYVCWMPDSVYSNSSTGNSELPSYVKNYALGFSDTMKLCGRTWNSVYDTITADGGTPYKLVFVWNNKVGASVPPAACVDNIEIFPLNSCALPRGLSVGAGEGCATVRWSGDADAYDVRCICSAGGEWQTWSGYRGDSLTVDGFGEGVYDVYVRSRCGGEYSAWVSCSRFIFFRGTRCIDYMDLENSSCFIGKIREPDWENVLVDNGYRDMYSRHTVHYVPGEKDDRTLGLLQTVPDGELASVRLGNWDVWSEKESIEYGYSVDTAENAILLLKYAVVMQDPGHRQENQPRFTLEVLKEDGSPLDEYGCAEADFFAGENTITEEGWHQTPGDPDTSPPLWKEWTTVGINLKEYHGGQLKIRLATYDCNEDGHYGYAYFTLGCSDGKIESLSCGDSEENLFKAPDGFRYRWYLPDNPDITLGDGQYFKTNAVDTLTYSCDVIHPVKEQCYYTVTAVATPRYPVADGDYEAMVDGCRNIVKFTDSSYVRHVNPETGEVTVADAVPDSVVWDFGDGTGRTNAPDPEHEFPREGGKFVVSLYAYLAAECVDVKSFEITLPRLDGVRLLTEAYGCKGTPYSYRGRNFYSDTVFSDTVHGVCANGCDSVFVLDLVFGRDTVVRLSDTVCADELPYVAGEKEYWEAGEYRDTLARTLSGCDSVVHLFLTVAGELDAAIDHGGIETCGDSIRIPLSVSAGMLGEYSMTFADEEADRLIGVGRGTLRDNTVAVMRHPELKPGSYEGEIVLDNAGCGDVRLPLALEVYYPDSLIAQRWNDLLGVKNSAFNGGYEFSSYRWYRNGVPMEGQDGANMYDGGGLDAGAVYTVLLTRADDGVAQFTCPYVPAVYGDIEVTPTVTFTGGGFGISSKGGCDVRLWSVSGQLVSSDRLPEGSGWVKAPAAPGVYVLEIIPDTGGRKAEKVVVKELR